MTVEDKLKVLVVEDNHDVQDILSMIVESNYHANVEILNSGQKAISYFKLYDSKVDLIISDFGMKDGTALELQSYLIDKKLDIPFILCTAEEKYKYKLEKTPNFLGVVEKPKVSTGILSLLDQHFSNFSVDNISREVEEEYCKIKLLTLLKCGPLPFDLFLRLSDKKFVNVVKKGDDFSKNDFQKFMGKQVNALYLKKNDAKRFVVLFEQMLLDYAQSQTKHNSLTLEFIKESQEIIHEFCYNLGWSNETQKLANSSIELALDLIQKDTSLLEIFSDRYLKDSDYMSFHNVTLCASTCAIASILDWSSEPVYIKLCLASLLHDIKLDPELNLLSLDKLDCKRKGVFTNEELDEYLQHPYQATELLKNMQTITDQVETIILQHHERPDGSGFPQKLMGGKIEPLAAIFIFAEDLVDSYFRDRANFSLPEFVSSREHYYSVGYFKKIIRNAPLLFTNE